MVRLDSREDKTRRAQWLRRPGIGLSVLLHLALLLPFFLLLKSPVPPLSALPPVVPIDIVHMGMKTAAPSHTNTPQPARAAPRTNRRAANPVAPHPIAKSTKPQPLDDIDAKLRALAKLRQPRAITQPSEHQGAANHDTGATNYGRSATYAVRDYVRAEIEKHWNPNLAMLGKRDFSIPLRIVLRSDGTIMHAEIVPSTQFHDDDVYRFIALSARNAALLASPLKLPPGDYPPTMDMVLHFNPREATR